MSIENFISNNALLEINTSSLKYSKGEPFPCISIDNFFKADVAKYLYENFPKMEEMPNIFNETMSYKGQLSDINGKWGRFSEIFNVKPLPISLGFIS